MNEMGKMMSSAMGSAMPPMMDKMFSAMTPEARVEFVTTMIEGFTRLAEQYLGPEGPLQHQPPWPGPARPGQGRCAGSCRSRRSPPCGFAVHGGVPGAVRVGGGVDGDEDQDQRRVIALQ